MNELKHSWKVKDRGTIVLSTVNENFLIGRGLSTADTHSIIEKLKGLIKVAYSNNKPLSDLFNF